METMKPQINPDQMPDFSNVIDPSLTGADEQWLRSVGVGESAPEAAQQFDALGRPVESRFQAVNDTAFSRPEFVVGAGARDTTPKIDLKLDGKTLEAKLEEDRVLASAKDAAKAAAKQWRTDYDNNAFLASQVLREQREKDEDDK